MRAGEGTKENIKLHYEIYGNGKPLIFLHGAFWNIEYYREFIDILSKKFKVIAVDLPFHGKSNNRLMDFSETSDIVYKICQNENIQNPSIISHSAGSGIAIVYASKFKVKKLYLIAPAGIRYFKHEILFYSKAIIAQPIMSLRFSGIKMLKIYKAGAEFIKKNRKTKNLLEFMNKLLKLDLRKDMNMIKCPVTIIWTKEDEMLPIRHSTEFLKNIKKSKLIIIHGCHNWPAFNPENIYKIDELKLKA